MEKFADEAIIEVTSGSGGNGCAAFRREKYVPRGGPSGGDGGRGGDVVFTVKRNLRTLAHLRYKHSFKAENGHDGEGAARYGQKGKDAIIPLPPGSIISNLETGELIRDFSKDTEDFVFLKGGNGGWGNIHFKSSVNQAPRNANSGKPGATVKLKVELQLMADIGFVGFPNAGKSSLLDCFTNARPKIAAYPFTTKIPNLGVLTIGDRDIIIADIPGLIEGASAGAGLGFRFLKHISRTAALAFLIDLSDDNYLDAFDILLNELKTYSEDMVSKKRLIVGTKTDLGQGAGSREQGAGSREQLAVNSEQLTVNNEQLTVNNEHLTVNSEFCADKRLSELKSKYPNEEIFGISVFTRKGIKELSYALLNLCAAAPACAGRPLCEDIEK